MRILIAEDETIIRLDLRELLEKAGFEIVAEARDGEEAASLADALAARKSIERAKGLLMEREGLTEQDAFARLRKASQISGRPLKVVAEALIATLDAR